jgi:hypothetical protein
LVEQLGLKLESARGSVEWLVLDHVDIHLLGVEHLRQRRGAFGYGV